MFHVNLCHIECKSTTPTEIKHFSGGLSSNARSFRLSLDSLTLQHSCHHTVTPQVCFWLVLATNDCFPTCTTLSKRAVLPYGKSHHSDESGVCYKPRQVEYTWMVDTPTKLCAKQQPYVFVLLIKSVFSL